MFYGNGNQYLKVDRPTTIVKLSEYDIVLTTYAIVEQAFRKQQYGVKRKGEMVKMKSLLHSMQWGRVVFNL